MTAPHIRVRPGDLVRVRTERWRIATIRSFDGSAIVEGIGIDAGNRSQRARFLLPFETIDRLVHDEHPRVVRPARWRHLARGVLSEAVSSPTALRTVADADLTILPFQLEPALALTHGLGTRVLIADAVGLGKTIQASIIVAETLARARDGHALVLCPAGLRHQWSEELDSRFHLDATIIDSAALACRSAADDGGVNPWAARPVVIASIDYVKRPEVLRGLEELLWDVIVLDEAHALSGRSDRAAAASALAERARSVVLLTATPHSGDDEAFSRMCDVGRLPGDPPLLVFRRTRRDAGLAESRRVRWLWIRPTPAEHLMHTALRGYTNRVWRTHTDASAPAALAMLVLARRAASSAQSLARSVERRLELLIAGATHPLAQLSLPFADPFADDDEPLAELAAPGLTDLSEERRHLERVLTLANAAAHGESKLRRLTKFLIAVRQPAIVFTEYRDTLASIAKALSGFECVLLHGGLTPVERRRAAEAFTRGNASVLLATDAASEGLNLHHRCRLVINLELPWTPLRLEQRVGRIDRLGQQRIVHAVHLVGGGSTEAELLQRLRRRDERARMSMEAIATITPQTIARIVIRGEDCPSPLTAPSPPEEPGVTPRLTEQAATEANRIRTARVLRYGKAAEVSTRPFVTFIRKRWDGDAKPTRGGMQRGAGGLASADGKGPRRLSTHVNLWSARSYSLWRFGVEGDDRSWLWDIYIAIAAHTPRSRPPSTDALRHLLAAQTTRLAGIRDRAAREAYERLTAAMRAPLAVALRREGAIAAALSAQRQTLAATLIQGGLLDRRTERSTTERRAILDAAADRCARRIDELTRSRRTTAGDQQLVFAVLLG